MMSNNDAIEEQSPNNSQLIKDTNMISNSDESSFSNVSEEIDIIPNISIKSTQIEVANISNDFISDSDPEYMAPKFPEIPSNSRCIIPESESETSSDNILKEKENVKVYYGSSVIGSDGDFLPLTETDTDPNYEGSATSSSEDFNETIKKKITKNKTKSKQISKKAYVPSSIENTKKINSAPKKEKPTQKINNKQSKKLFDVKHVRNPLQTTKSSYKLKPGTKKLNKNKNEPADPSDTTYSESEIDSITDNILTNKKEQTACNKIHGCLFCGQQVKKFATHLEKHHGDQIEVKKLLALPKTSKGRSKLINNLDLLSCIENSTELMTSKQKPIRKERKIKENKNDTPVIITNTDQRHSTDSEEENNNKKINKKCELMKATNQKGKRTWDKLHGCLYCGKAVKKFALHLQMHHSDQGEVEKFLALPKNTQQRRELIENLRQKGNYLFNSKVIKQGDGSVIPKRRQNSNVTKKRYVEEYVPCNNCLGFYQKKTIYAHFNRCIYKKDARKSNSSTCSALFPVSDQASNLLKENVLAKMSQDVIFHTIRSDDLIMKYGSHLYTKHGTEKHLHQFVAQKMREVGRLVHTLREVNPNIRSLSDVYYPPYFADFITSVKKVAGFDELTNAYAIPSLATKIGTAVKLCAGLLKSQAIIENDSKKRAEIEDFIYLYESFWKHEISSKALKTTYRKKWNTTDKLPLADDISKLNDYLRNEASRIVSGKLEPETWQALCNVTMAQTIIFNRRRAGEVERALLKYYLMAEKIPISRDVEKTLTNSEKYISKDLLRFEVQGKRGRKVPIILTVDLQKQYNILINNREKYGVPEENPYIFGKPGTNDPIKAGPVIEYFSKQCGAKNPENLRSTKLRKQIATACQVLNLKENEMDQIATYMGHDIRVHRQFYRLPESTTQLTKVSKLLISLDQGSLLSNKGKDLDSIQICNPSDNIENVDTNNACSIKILEDLNDLSTDLKKQNLNVLKPKPQTRSSKQSKNYSDSSHSESDSSTGSKIITKLKPTKKNNQKRPWSLEEKEAVLRIFQQSILLGKVPNKSQCDDCLRKEPALSNRTWTQIKYFVYNQIQKISGIKRKKN